jgi:enoyl-CoA hydratase/carnithine racemase
MFGAREAYEMGLVSELVPDSDVEKRALEMARNIADLPPLAVEQAKEAVNRGMDAALETGLALEAKAIQLLFSSQDQKEGMAAFIEKRKPKFVGK